MMGNPAWKKAERRVAKLFGSTRVGARGDTSYDVMASSDYDVKGRRLGIEVKHGKGMPKWLLDALAQAKGHAVTVDEPTDSLVVLMPKGARVKDGLAVVPLEEYEALRKAAAERTFDPLDYGAIPLLSEAGYVPLGETPLETVARNLREKAAKERAARGE